jgi:hypothetical protein
MFPMIGAMIHPDPKRSLVIGLGTGESAGWLASLPSMEQVDVVELEPVIRHVADVCSPLNHDVLRHPKVRVVFNDGREVLQTSRGAYDLIASEPSNPYRAGVANLYTLEFYESVRARLAPEGLFLQWLQGYEIDTPTIRTVLQTAQRAFGHVEIWETKPDDLVLVCSLTPHEYDLNRLRSRLSEPAYQAAVQFAWRTTSVEGVLSHFLANEKYVAAVADQQLAAINTDDRNVLEYAFARSLGRRVGGLLATGMREEARKNNFHRPLRIATAVDWEAVEDQRIAFYVGVGENPLPARLFSGERALRAQALNEIFLEQFANGVTTWSKQPRPPQDLADLTLLALARASLGQEEAKPLIEQLAATAPVDAEALRGILAVEQKRYDDAARHLTTVAQRVRAKPGATTRVLEAALQRMVQLAERDARHAPALFQAIGEPFAVYHLDLRRRLSRYFIAQHINDAAKVKALADLEPNVPWNAEFLQLRLSVYERTTNPRAAQAQRDLNEFLYWMPEPFVLRPGS